MQREKRIHFIVSILTWKQNNVSSVVKRNAYVSIWEKIPNTFFMFLCIAALPQKIMFFYSFLYFVYFLKNSITFLL